MCHLRVARQDFSWNFLCIDPFWIPIGKQQSNNEGEFILSKTDQRKEKRNAKSRFNSSSSSLFAETGPDQSDDGFIPSKTDQRKEKRNAKGRLTSSSSSLLAETGSDQTEKKVANGEVEKVLDDEADPATSEKRMEEMESFVEHSQKVSSFDDASECSDLTNCSKNSKKDHSGGSNFVDFDEDLSCLSRTAFGVSGLEGERGCLI